MAGRRRCWPGRESYILQPPRLTTSRPIDGPTARARRPIREILPRLSKGPSDRAFPADTEELRRPGPQTRRALPLLYEREQSAKAPKGNRDVGNRQGSG